MDRQSDDESTGGFISGEKKKFHLDEEEATLNHKGTENLRTGANASHLEEPVKREMVEFDNGIKYDGEWLHDHRHGYGVQEWPDGAKYVGYWANGKAEGKGKFTHVGGDTYEGDWKQDKAHGHGTYIHAKTKAVYEGEWDNDLQHGYGR